MWIKVQKNNLVCWFTGQKRTYHKYDEELHLPLINDDDEKVDFLGSTNGTYVIQKQESDIKILPAGIYKTIQINYETYLVEFSLPKGETILELDVSNKVLKDFNKFLDSKELYKTLGLENKYRRGILMYGPPGTGKTSITHSIIQNINLENSLVIFTTGRLSLEFLKAFTDDPRLKIIIFEEFTQALGSDFEAGGDLLGFLDGEQSLNNTFIIATTNYPEKLPKNIIDRPGRFDEFYEISGLTIQDICLYLNHFNIQSNNVDFLTNKTIAELKEIMLIHKRDGLTLLAASEKINKQKEKIAVKFKVQTRDDSDYLL